MQYGLNLENYKRLNSNEKNIACEKDIFYNDLGLLFVSVLISRVMLLLNKGDISGLAPFGIAFLISISYMKSIKKYIIASVGVGVGYVSILSYMGGDYINLILLSIILGLYIFSCVSDKKVSDSLLFVAIFIGSMIYGLLVRKYSLGVNVTLSLLNTVVIIPVSYILRYGIRCIEELNNNYMFNIEEIISIGIFVCLVVSGIGSISILGIDIRDLVSYLLILVIAYSCGGNYGAAIGVTIGVIVGLNSKDMIYNVALYSSIGLVAGIFKDTGRLFSFLAYFIMYMGISFYSDTLTLTSIIEIVLAGIIYIVIPRKLYDKVELELNYDKKINKISDMELDEVRNEFFKKTKQIKIAFSSVSGALKLPRINFPRIF